MDCLKLTVRGCIYDIVTLAAITLLFCNFKPRLFALCQDEGQMGSFGNNACFLSWAQETCNSQYSSQADWRKTTLRRIFRFILTKSGWALFKQELLFKNKLCVWAIESQLVVEVGAPVEGKWLVGQVDPTLLNVQEHQLHLDKFVGKKHSFTLSQYGFLREHELVVSMSSFVDSKMNI